LGAEGSPIVALEAEVLKEMNSLTRFLFLSRLGYSECAGGGNVVELVLSSESSASSSSWLSLASGALDAAETGLAWIDPSSGRGGRDARNWWPYTKISCKTLSKQQQWKRGRIKFGNEKAHTKGNGCSESKKSVVNAGILSSFVRVVNALTRLSRSFLSRSSLETREESSEPEYDHNFETRCCRGWISL
jgi:hypothetical protein